MTTQQIKASIEPSRTTGERLVLIAGTSGTGKDTLMYRVARMLKPSGVRVRVTRRWITRPSHHSENFFPVTREEFEAAAKEGKFVLWWFIYGLYYGVPREIEDWLCNGEIVLVNLSRSVLHEARERYSGCKIVKVEVPPAEAERRIRSRGRERGFALEARIRRMNEPVSVLDPDLIIQNVNLGESIRKLAAFLQQLA
ncbi:MAG: phosphonate metabolism protein/1,5-bisphosphokinase (PRPP-forming) PhnN [Candidatus Odinarchaeota archaeon]